MLTAEQKQLRQQFIGSSDAAAILGCDPYRTPADVWLEKTGKVDQFEGNENTDRGNLLEPVILNWAEKELGVELIRDQMFTDGCLCANVDALVRNAGSIVEAKSSVLSESWGDPGTDDIPEQYLIQVHHALRLTERDLAHVPVLLPAYRKFDFRMYRVERDDRLAELIAGQLIAWWDMYVKRDIPPENYQPSMEVLKRVRRIPAIKQDVPDHLVTLWLMTKEQAKAAKEAADEAQRQVVAALNNAEAGRCSKGTLTYFETTRRAHSVEESTFRTLRWKPLKENQ